MEVSLDIDATPATQGLFGRAETLAFFAGESGFADLPAAAAVEKIRLCVDATAEAIDLGRDRARVLADAIGTEEAVFARGFAGSAVLPRTEDIDTFAFAKAQTIGARAEAIAAALEAGAGGTADAAVVVVGLGIDAGAEAEGRGAFGAVGDTLARCTPLAVGASGAADAAVFKIGFGIDALAAANDPTGRALTFAVDAEFARPAGGFASAAVERIGLGIDARTVARQGDFQRAVLGAFPDGTDFASRAGEIANAAVFDIFFQSDTNPQAVGLIAGTLADAFDADRTAFADGAADAAVFVIKEEVDASVTAA